MLVYNQVYKQSQDYLTINNMENKIRVAPQQLIDQNRLFYINAIKSIQASLPNVQKQYQTVAIIGVQNSGKSTLLNLLFETNFDVLQQVAGTRTTRGILTSLDKEKNLIIMDVQGNDSQDRAQHQEYEKMVSTFALVSADVLIINIFAKTLGQYTGSQYQTLTAVLDICIQQFRQESPKTLLFCVRDFNNEVDDEGEIRRKIIKDINNIWLKIQKPADYQKYNQTPEKFFAVEVAVLRRYRKQNPKPFTQDITKLRLRFTEPKEDGYVFKQKKNSFNMPLHDLPDLMDNSWKSILTNKKLNLPNQKQQLSNFRCSEILAQLLNKFKEQIISLQKSKSIIDMSKFQQKYFKQFQQKTYNYGKHVVLQKQNTLKQQIKSTVNKLVHEIIQFQEKRLKDQFRTDSSYINQDNSKTLDGKLIQMKNQAVQKYSGILRAFNFEVVDRKEKIQKLAKFIETQNAEIIKRSKQIITVEFQKESSRQIRLLSSEILKNHFGKDLWSHADKLYTAKRNSLVTKLQMNILWIQDRTLQPGQIDALDQKLSDQLKKQILQDLQKSLINRVFDKFLSEFTKTKQGDAYNFNILQEAKIVQLYDKARDNSRQLVALINKYNIKQSRKSIILQFEVNEQDSLFQSTWLSNALTELDRRMIQEHETIIRRKKESQMKKVPIWLFVIIFFFVYDDMWFSQEEYPFLNKFFTFILLFATFFFAIGQGNAFMQLWNFVLQIGSHGADYIKKKIGK